MSIYEQQPIVLEGLTTYPLASRPSKVTVRDFAGNEDSQVFSYTVNAPPEGTKVWQDTFESDLGWVTDPDGTDTASLGMWERGDPEATDSSGPKQLGATAIGSNDR